MNWLWRLIFFLLGHQFKRQLVRDLKKRGLLTYLRALRTFRWIVVVLVMAVLALQFMLLAGFGALVTGFLLWDYDFNAKMQILFGVFVAAFFIPVVLLMILLSERLWFHLSGAARYFEDVRD